VDLLRSDVKVQRCVFVWVQSMYVVASDLQSPILRDQIGSKAFDIEWKDNTSESTAFRCLGAKMWTHLDAAVWLQQLWIHQLCCLEHTYDPFAISNRLQSYPYTMLRQYMWIYCVVMCRYKDVNLFGFVSLDCHQSISNGQYCCLEPAEVPFATSKRLQSHPYIIPRQYKSI